MIMYITFNTVTVYNTLVMPICLWEKFTNPIGLLPQGNLGYHFMPTENMAYIHWYCIQCCYVKVGMALHFRL